MSITQQLIAGGALSLVIMKLTWLICVRLNNGSWVDVVWAFTIGLLATGYQFTGSAPETLNPAWIITLIWSFRLGFHLYKRVSSEPEDGRYVELKIQWGGVRSPMMAGFFFIQALAAFVFSLPAAFVIHYSNGEFGPTTLIAITIAVLALVGEGMADRQLRTFKAKSNDPLAVCNTGLWRYSRHPNYFFEWLHWFAYPFLVFGTSAFWPMFLAPGIMFLLITKFSGIPPTEAQALRKRGDRYRQYQKQTSAFIPWIPKNL